LGGGTDADGKIESGVAHPCLPPHSKMSDPAVGRLRLPLPAVVAIPESKPASMCARQDGRSRRVRHGIVVIAGVEVRRQRDLFAVVEVDRVLCPVLGAREPGQKQASQNGDDGNDDQQLDECEPSEQSAVPNAPRFTAREVRSRNERIELNSVG
jgi:hypothetical protein